MSALCPTNSQAFRDSELIAPYTGPSVMSATMPDDNGEGRTKDEYHLLTPSWLAGHINNLKGKGIIPAPPDMKKLNKQSEDDAIKAYIGKVDQLKALIKAEYCYYEARYKYAMTQYINYVATAESEVRSKVRTDELNSIATRLNVRLQDLSQIVNAITEDQYETVRRFQTDINAANSQIQTYLTTLKEHAQILRKEAPGVELRKRMVQYTKEKANANKNLLSLYFFLDVVALGLLFYIYKAQ